MKITISPSEDQSAEKFPYYSVTIESNVADDNCTIEQIVEMMFMALVGWGYDKDIAAKAFHEFIQ
jgi:hypothetical protein